MYPFTNNYHNLLTALLYLFTNHDSAGMRSWIRLI